MNKASGGDGIPVKLLQILKDDAVKVLHSIFFPLGPVGLAGAAPCVGVPKGVSEPHTRTTAQG